MTKSACLLTSAKSFVQPKNFIKNSPPQIYQKMQQESVRRVASASSASLRSTETAACRSQQSEDVNSSCIEKIDETSFSVPRQHRWPEGSEFLSLDFSPNQETVHRWKKLSDCDEFVGARRSKHTMVAYKNAIYVFGGDNGKHMLNDLIRFDRSDGSWCRSFTMGVLPAPRYHHSAIVYESSMYIFGGYTGDIHSNSNLTNKNDLYEYKFATGQWSELRCEGKLPPARSAHGAAVHEGKMWIFGGFDGHQRLNDMWCVSLVGPIHKWLEIQQLGDCPPPCCNFATAVIKDCMYLFSGQSGARSTNLLFEFNFSSCTWSRISTEHILRAATPAPKFRYGHTMVAHDRRLYVFGGAAESIYPPDLHCYDLDSQMWSIVKPATSSVAPIGRLFHSAVVLNEAMYVFGGTIDNTVRSSEMFRFQLASYPRCTVNEDFGRLLESRQFCDLRFLVGKDKVAIYANIAIVAARSQYLRNKIKQAREHPAPENVAVGDGNNENPRLPSARSKGCPMLDVYIPDAEPFAFEMILDYIYTDKIDPTHRGQEPSSNGVVLLMMDVYRLALQFSMKRLESLCVQYLESVIGLRNALVTLQAASRLGLHYIKEYCMKFIIKECNYNHIIMTKEFETLEQWLMVEIIRRRQLPVYRANNESPPTTTDGPTLQDDMKAFLESGIGSEFCDITLVCQDVAIPAHKVILAARSAYFEAMFRSWMPETNTVQMTLGELQPSSQAFQSLLRYIYYGCVDMPPEDSLYLFGAPAYYGFSNNRMEVYCKENLETNIRTDNVLDVLEAADTIQANEMKRHALRLIVEHFSKVAQQSKLRSLSKKLLLDIIDAVAQSSSATVDMEAVQAVSSCME